MLSAINTSSLLTKLRQPCCAQLEFVRWRKPRWIPMAKSKMFKVPVKKRQSPEDMAELQMLLQRYEVLTKSLWTHQQNAATAIEGTQATDTADAEAEINSAMEGNDRINAIIRERREKLEAERWKETEREILERKEALELQEEERLKETEEEVKRQIERLKFAIKKEELDEVIERALAQEVDYNFAIDTSGNIYAGRHNNGKITHPPKDPLAIVEPLKLSLGENTA